MLQNCSQLLQSRSHPLQSRSQLLQSHSQLLQSRSQLMQTRSQLLQTRSHGPLLQNHSQLLQHWRARLGPALGTSGASRASTGFAMPAGTVPGGPKQKNDLAKKCSPRTIVKNNYDFRKVVFSKKCSGKRLFLKGRISTKKKVFLKIKKSRLRYLTDRATL